MPTPALPITVVVALPAHSALAGTALHYTHPQTLEAGCLVRVPLGKRTVLGVVWDEAALPEHLALDKLKPIEEVLTAVAPLNAEWRQLVQFTAQYYQRSLGEVALMALPPALRNLSDAQLVRSLKRKGKAGIAPTPDTLPPLTTQQQAVLTQLAQTPAQQTVLLFGATGSGKTEVYMRLAEEVLARDAHSQVLVLVPEINLTPQLEQRFAQRFHQHQIASLHSGLTPAQRLRHWLSAHSGQARIILGTRMAVLASLPHLQLIVVDEEHDPSYKQQENARYSARDLAIYRGHKAGIRVLLGSATPSLESWYHSRPASNQDAGGRYLRLHMPQRVGQATLPEVHIVDTSKLPAGQLISPALQAAMQERLARGEQCMVLLNRRGYAPVLHCRDCDWKSECPQCSAYRVYHKVDRTLRCHHCGLTERVPHSCPSCGNMDIHTLGQGTEQLEELLTEQLQHWRLPDGRTPRVARIDADTTRHVGSLEHLLDQVHQGQVDVLVGTQMVAKGHDFRGITLVAALNPDGGLFSSDYRAPERLFSLLMQAGGRAGRDGSAGSLWVQTDFASHALFAALQRHDYPGFAAAQLQERQQAGMPPFSYQAVVRAEGREQKAVQDFLNHASTQALTSCGHQRVFAYPAIPAIPQRVAMRERAQMLLESENRAALQQFLQHLQHALHHLPSTGIVRWAIDVDPLNS